MWVSPWHLPVQKLHRTRGQIDALYAESEMVLIWHRLLRVGLKFADKQARRCELALDRKRYSGTGGLGLDQAFGL